MKKLIDFKTANLVDSIQKYADKFCEGNFNMAVRMLTKNALTEEQENAELRALLSNHHEFCKMVVHGYEKVRLHKETKELQNK